MSCDRFLVAVESLDTRSAIPHSAFGKEYTIIMLLSALDRSRDSTAKRNLSKDMQRTQGVLNWRKRMDCLNAQLAACFFSPVVEGLRVLLLLSSKALWCSGQGVGLAFLLKVSQSRIIFFFKPTKKGRMNSCVFLQKSTMIDLFCSFLGRI